MEAMPFLSAFDNGESIRTTSKPKVDRRKQLKSVARIGLLTTACILTLVFIFETWYIQHLHSTTQRYNDNFDNAFYNLNWQSPKIWDERQQAMIRNALPVPVHSHNDYWQDIPLWEALGSGCIGVEADVHLRKSELLVGHSSRSLNKERTLRAMYLDPLQKIITAQNENTTQEGEEWKGIFNRAPKQTVVLLIDIKTPAEETFAELRTQLQPLRDLDLLTHWNGTHRVIRPLTIVATGNTLFTSILNLPSIHRDIFYDAHLEQLPNTNDDWTNPPTPLYKYNTSNSYYASTRISSARVQKYRFSPGAEQEAAIIAGDNPQFLDISDSQPNQAKRRGLVTRYWDIKKQKNEEEGLWRWLMDNDAVGVLNMDDMGVVRDRARGWANFMSRVEV